MLAMGEGRTIILRFYHRISHVLALASPHGPSQRPSRRFQAHGPLPWPAPAKEVGGGAWAIF